MTTLIVLLIVLALVFGVGAVVEGIAWAFLIGLALLAIGAWLGWQRLRDFSSSS